MLDLLLSDVQGTKTQDVRMEKSIREKRDTCDLLGIVIVVIDLPGQQQHAYL